MWYEIPRIKIKPTFNRILRMKSTHTLVLLLSITLIFELPTNGQAVESVQQATGSLLKVEAEDFYKQTKTDQRKWYVVSAGFQSDLKSEEDSLHLDDASGGKYLEVLPDTRTNHQEKLVHGVNFSNEPGVMAVVHYQVNLTDTGRYYIWVRAYSTGSEDNGVHVGMDGQWPESGQRMQWCEVKNSWKWASKQRTREQHCGVPGLIYLDVKSPGAHDIQFSMREDGFEMDQWIMTTDPEYNP
ncbi:MAG: hypothetical protein DHS20C17_33980 [Cyclobacteriaceae bacterium]|nr:MAG: hypothetical protein DHS20C17_33980 [Cyclobacteriaceae bacterium]